MANRVKEVSAFNGTSWGAAVPLGANDANIDITSSTSQPDGSAVSGVTGDSATALDTAAVAVASGDTGASAWTKFNRFRKRVASNFANYIQGSIATSYNAIGSDSAVYSTGVINNYMENVIGYSGTTTPAKGTIISQLSAGENWEYFNDALGQVVIDISSLDFKELLIQVDINESGNKELFYIPQRILSNASNYFRLGGYYSGTLNALVTVLCALTSVSLREAFLNGQNYLNGSRIQIYYR